MRETARVSRILSNETLGGPVGHATPHTGSSRVESHRNNSQVLESARQSGRGRIRSAGGNVFLENVRRDRRQSSHWWQVDTHAYRLKQVARDRVESLPVYPVCMCIHVESLCVCVHAALFIRAVNQGRYDITLCETKRGGRVCRADMFRYVTLGDRDNARANAEVT